MNKCTCGSQAVNHPGHSHWCDSLKEDNSITWSDFLYMANAGYAGTYVYITHNFIRNNKTITPKTGLFLCFNPNYFRVWSSMRAESSVNQIWIEDDCLDGDTMEEVYRMLGGQGRLRICSS